MKQKKRSLLLAQLSENLALLEKSMTALAYSYEKCDAIGEKEEYDLEEQESFEALTSRFARTSDILTQKVIKTLKMPKRIVIRTYHRINQLILRNRRVIKAIQTVCVSLPASAVK
jgi:hypothetical protein